MKTRWWLLLLLVAVAGATVAWRLRRAPAPVPPAAQQGASALKTITPAQRAAYFADPDAPRGAIEGRVLLPDGKPAEEALVIALTGDREQSRDGRPLGIAHAQAGRYRIDGLAPGDYVVSATAPARTAAFRGGLQLLPGETLHDIDITLGKEGVKISGFVRDSGGGPIARPEVRAARHSRDAGDAFVVIGGDDGAYAITVPAGSYTLTADAEGYAPADKLVEARADQRVDLSLNPAATLRGRVVERGSGKPVASASVSIEARGLFARERSVSADGLGVFELKDVDPGSYQLRATSGSLVGFSKPIDVALGGFIGEILIECDRGRTISGHVRTAQGGPVADARLLLRGGGLSLRAGSSARSVADGAYKLEGILPGQYDLYGSATGFAPETRSDLRVDDKDLTVDLVLTGGASVAGKVLDADGKPVEGAVLSAWVSGNGLMPRGAGSDRSTADGSFAIRDLGAGALHLDASHVQKGSGQLEAALAAGEQKTVELKLAPSATVSGTVRWDDGSPAIDVSVQAVQLPMGRAQTRSVEGGAFTLTGLGKGAAHVFASRSDGDLLSGYQRGAGAKSVTLEANERRTGVELVVERGGHRIAGIVLDPDGHPLAGAGVGATAEDNGEARPRVRVMGMGDTAKTFSGADGAFTLEDLTKGTFTLWATHAGLPEAERHGVAADSTGVRLQFRPAASISGVVVAGGKPVVDYTISAVAKNGAPEQQRVTALLGGDRQTVHDAAGAFSIGGLSAGSYDVSASASDGRVGSARDVAVGDGERKSGVTINIDKGATLKGHVVELGNGAAVAGARVMITTGGQPTNATTDAAGAFQVNGAAPGVAAIMVIGDVMSLVPDQREVTVGSQEVVDVGTLKLLRGRVMDHVGTDVGLRVNNRDAHVTVSTVRAGSPADKAGVKVGEPLTAVDGQATDELGSIAVAYLLGGAVGTKVQIVVAGRTLTLTREAR